jgi:hypothetical protein
LGLAFEDPLGKPLPFSIETMVDSQNVHRYVQLMIHWYMKHRYMDAIMSLHTGFQKVIQQPDFGLEELYKVHYVSHHDRMYYLENQK